MLKDMGVKSLLRSKLLIPIFAALLLFSVASGARAANICVGCASAGAGCDVLVGSVGAAMGLANTNVTAFDNIKVAFGTYPESFPGIPIVGILAPDTIEISGAWNPADCSTQEMTIIPSNRTTTINAAAASNIFNVIAILFPLQLSVEGFTLTGGVGLGGVIGGAIDMISAILGSFTLTATNNVFVNNNTLVGGAISMLTVGILSNGTGLLDNNLCFDNTAFIGGCLNTISAIGAFSFYQGRNNIMAQNTAILGGAQGFTSILAAGSVERTRNNTVADNVGIVGGGDFQLNVPTATNSHNSVSDMTISNRTGANLGNNSAVIGLLGIITIRVSRAVNLGRNAAGDTLPVGGGAYTGLTASGPCDGVGANSLGSESSSAVQFVDNGGFDYNLPDGSPCNTAGVKDNLAGEAPFPTTDYKGVVRDASIGAAENAVATPTPTPTPTGTPTPTPGTPTPTPTPGGGGGGGSCNTLVGPVQVGSAMANVLIPLIPVAFAFGVRAIRRRKK